MILLIRKRTLLYTWLAVCIMGLSAIFLAGSRRAFTPTGAMGQGSRIQTVVIDPGHGGQDGGAVAADGTVLLSIHQNSLPSSPVTHGAQTFWNRQEGAEALARTLQAGLNPVVNTHRAKEPKQIPDSIYLMNHVDAPAVLVECGFLSNREEAARLQQEDYQKTLAAVIAAGYLRWMAGEDRK